jgi:hypothetical protein
MYCKSCGKQIPDDAAVCMLCGASTSDNSTQKNYSDNSPKKAYASLATMGGGVVFTILSAFGGGLIFFGLLYVPAFIVSLVLGASSLKHSSAARGCAKGGMITSIVMLSIVVIALFGQL